jgi:transmembrane sensor
VSSSTLPLPRKKPVPSATCLQQAAEWYAQLRSSGATSDIKKQWQHWLQSSTEHQQAWSYVESISQRFEPAYPKAQAVLLASSYQKVDRKRIQRRHILAGFALFASAGMLGVGTGIHVPVIRLTRSWSADYATGVGQMRDIDLPDGTHVWMNTATTLNVDYQASLRRLALVDGEILIDTKKDPRPFVVDNSHGRLRALGTRFTVRQLEDRIHLAVFDGAVEITTSRGVTKIIERGQQTRFNHDSIDVVHAASDTDQVWTKGVLLAHNMTLSAFVAEMGRYHHGHIGVSEEVAQLRVFGSFPAHDRALTLSMLESVLPVKVTETLPWWINIAAVPAAEDNKKDAAS